MGKMLKWNTRHKTCHATAKGNWSEAFQISLSLHSAAKRKPIHFIWNYFYFLFFLIKFVFYLLLIFKAVSFFLFRLFIFKRCWSKYVWTCLAASVWATDVCVCVCVTVLLNILYPPTKSVYVKTTLLSVFDLLKELNE